MMMADVMEALGITRGDYVIRVNNRKVLDGVLEAIGLGGEENAGRRLTVLRAIDKLDKFGAEGVRLLLGEGRWDGGKEGEGDFTKGAGLDEDASDKSESSSTDFSLLARWQSRPWRTTRQSTAEPWSSTISRHAMHTIIGVSSSQLGQSSRACASFDRSLHLCDAAGYGADRIRIDPSVVRGLEYYTGPVYEAELTCPRSPTRRARSCASARSAAAGAMTGWCRASAASRCRRPAFPSASRA